MFKTIGTGLAVRTAERLAGGTGIGFLPTAALTIGAKLLVKPGRAPIGVALILGAFAFVAAQRSGANFSPEKRSAPGKGRKRQPDKSRIADT